MSEAATPTLTLSSAHGLRKKFIACGVAGLVNLLGAQVLRLVGNLILTRLLFPEIFGLMAMVNVFLIGLALVSNLGIGSSIIQRKESPSESFLQTAWTLQSIRALGLWVVTALLAWPLASIYEEPRLVWLLPVVAITQIISGFESTSVHLCARELRHNYTAALDLGTAVVGTVASILFALWLPSVWALVAGGMISAVVRTTFSYFLPLQIHHRFHLDRDASRELIHFGKWLLLASAFTFIVSEGDRIILGKFLTLAELGVYTVAFFFAQAVVMLARGIAMRTLFPIFSRLKDESHDTQRSEYFRYQKIFLGLSILPIAFFLLAGPLVIELLYDDRYLDAGRMLQFLSIGSAGAILRALAGPVILSRGNSFVAMIISGFEAFILITCMLIGGSLWGLYGYIGGFVVAQYLSHIPGVVILRRYQIWNPKTELTFLICTSLITLLGFFIWK